MTTRRVGLSFVGKKIPFVKTLVRYDFQRNYNGLMNIFWLRFPVNEDCNWQGNMARSTFRSWIVRSLISYAELFKLFAHSQFRSKAKIWIKLLIKSELVRIIRWKQHLKMNLNRKSSDGTQERPRCLIRNSNILLETHIYHKHNFNSVNSEHA